MITYSAAISASSLLPDVITYNAAISTSSILPDMITYSATISATNVLAEIDDDKKAIARRACWRDVLARTGGLPPGLQVLSDMPYGLGHHNR